MFVFADWTQPTPCLDPRAICETLSAGLSSCKTLSALDVIVPLDIDTRPADIDPALALSTCPVQNLASASWSLIGPTVYVVSQYYVLITNYFSL